MDSLLPCPFCGEVDAVGVAICPEAKWCVFCPCCVVEGPIAESRTAAITAWNTRTPSRAQVRAEVLREVAEEGARHGRDTDWLRARADKEESDG